MKVLHIKERFKLCFKLTLAHQSKPKPDVESGCTTRASQVAWASRELMDLIEAVPLLEQFIHLDDDIR